MLFKHNNRLPQLRNRYVLLADIAIFLVSPLLALGLRLDGAINVQAYYPQIVWFTLAFLLIKLGVLGAFGGYRRCWRYASVDELQQITLMMLAAIALQTLAFAALSPTWLAGLPRSLPLLDAIVAFLLVGALRFRVRTLERLGQSRRTFFRRDRVLVVGAGSAGVSLVQEMQRNPSLGLRPVAFVDDDPAKLHLRIRKLPVAGNRSQIPELVRSLHIRKVIIAMPTVSGSVIRETVEICQRAGVQTSTLPGIHEILNGRVSLGRVRDVQIEDLLRRDPVQMEGEQVANLVRGKRVLVTGAGGSIGSELCRQLLQCHPAELILVGHGENSIFNIQQELKKVVQGMGDRPKISPFIADIRFRHRLEHGFRQFQPQMVFHAAAHKHVPMMESNAAEAVTNNILGTQNLVTLAQRYQVEHFVMISTDKAVNPTNIMGASKRVAEMLVLQAARQSGQRYEVVRFGNVLGSRGSVVPTFKRQIAEGGPITVTHPDICRYFMTIPEAVQLVLQAATMGQGGEVFMLDMGQPVKIVDLAKELIRLSGYELGKTMHIVFTGLRPGEKLYEELFVGGEQYTATRHPKLFVVTNASGIVPAQLDRLVRALGRAALRHDPTEITFLLEQLVPGFRPQYQPSVTAPDPAPLKPAVEPKPKPLPRPTVEPRPVSVLAGSYDKTA
ncbi:polysaccharide biosynthesis protein [Nodosilinea sp. PGN35]|uniref:polysaccharide biosynthesis protein n=1 Tax=Nodosilinea sp. PGN35 TaxID=3020489 RepID=UPI0023B309A5|nr:nucleoside-diphosphate sugar epimerase/dehydratase [Nodosilinea sp. TSF1-S3]MDF0367104.1 nucleoside-diphosphate sugar epimerase/dehydratase [Nodosilinea sp. TSF1-S3]